ncbi:MAG: peptide chain release factor 2 [Thermodesulfobacteriota bacterium]
MLAELDERIGHIQEQIAKLKDYLDVPKLSERLAALDAVVAKDDFWEDQDRAKKVLKERTQLAAAVESYQKLAAELEDARVLGELASEENDQETAREAAAQLDGVEAGIRRQMLSRMLSGADDEKDAIVSINAGAGGTDAQDWAEILLRMYLRWADQKGYKTEIIDTLPGDEAGIKSATFSVEGPYAYGYLKLEEGVHRLVRISPFNASGKRHTSFSSVAVFPQADEEIEIEIAEKDLRIETFRASGAGGQHVNKTSSAVRLVHIPTGIVVSCQQEKSQHRNRDLAMKVLKARLYQKEKEEQEKKRQKVYDEKEDIAWGSQIRSYVLQPYQLVKDHRTAMEVGNVQAVLDGDLDGFMEQALLSRKTKAAVPAANDVP